MGKIIFILSVGHSGSTLTDIALGQFSNAFSTGELKHLTWQYYRKIENWPSKQKCTCGKYFDECEIWANVIKDLADYKSINPNDVPKRVTIKHFDNLLNTTNYKKDKLLRYIYKINLLHEFIPQRLFHKYFDKVNDNNIQIYESVFQLLPKIDYIIDSSKDIIRYSELKNKINSFPIILIRDINEVMNSKWVTQSAKKANSWQSYYNGYLLPTLIKMREEDFHVISYEKFIDNPRAIIAELAKKLNLNIDEFNTSIPMDRNHVVAGGGMRYTDVVTINKRTVDENKLKNDLFNANLDKFFIDRI